MARAKKNAAAGGSKRGTRKRRGKAEDVTGAQEGAVETRKASDTQESMALPKPDDAEYHRKQILGYLDKKETANSHYRTALKTAQKAGIDTDAMLAAHRLKRSNDHSKMQRHYSQLGFYLEQEGYPIKLTVSDTLEQDSETTAYQRGFSDAKDGLTYNNKYPEGTGLNAKYSLGYSHGAGANLGLTPEQVDAANAEQSEGGVNGEKKWPDDEHVAGHGTDPKVDEAAWNKNAEDVVNGKEPALADA